MSEKGKKLIINISITVIIVIVAAILGAVAGEFLLDNLI